MRGCDTLAPTCQLRNEERLMNVCLYELGRCGETGFGYMLGVRTLR